MTRRPGVVDGGPAPVVAQVTVSLHGVFRDFAGASRFAVQAATVGEAIDRAVEQCPVLRERLRDERGRIRAHTNVFVDRDHIRWLRGEDTPLHEGSIVHIIPAVSGGSGSA